MPALAQQVGQLHAPITIIPVSTIFMSIFAFEIISTKAYNASVRLFYKTTNAYVITYTTYRNSITNTLHCFTSLLMRLDRVAARRTARVCRAFLSLYMLYSVNPSDLR